MNELLNNKNYHPPRLGQSYFASGFEFIRKEGINEGNFILSSQRSIKSLFPGSSGTLISG